MRSPRPPLPVLIGIALLVATALVRSDAIRERAEVGLGRGMPPREAELARGFVLGADENIDARTEEDFRRAGLSHLLAVSGQNITLLALLAMPLLAAFGIPLRERLFWVLGLIAIYVPLAGAGPSIQRAGVMGAAGLLATLAGRRASRSTRCCWRWSSPWRSTPASPLTSAGSSASLPSPGSSSWASPLREAIVARIGSGGWRRALAEGIAVTVAATLATAPLIAFHFETLSTTTLARQRDGACRRWLPAMWLGMLSAAAAQVPGLPLDRSTGWRPCCSPTSPRWPPGAVGRAGPTRPSTSARTGSWPPISPSPPPASASRASAGAAVSRPSVATTPPIGRKRPPFEGSGVGHAGRRLP
jgi:hypothetical protein